LNPERVVFWDIDGTLVSPSLERLFLRFLLRAGHVTPAGLARRGLDRLARHGAGGWHRVKLAYLAGMEERDVAGLIERCWEAQIVPALRPGALAALGAAARRGAAQVLLSGTIEPLARRLARHLHVSEVIAARPEVIGGRYTGGLETVHPHGRHKVERAGAWLARAGWGWERTVAVADHVRDRHLLGRVAIAVAVEPGFRLRRAARRRGWLVARDADLPDLLRGVL
jgi:HAD superfamily phosphoserine phosphatase-like hydrolase